VKNMLYLSCKQFLNRKDCECMILRVKTISQH